MTEDDLIRISLVRKIDESYYVIFGDDIFPRIAYDLKEKPIGEKYAIITDSNVERLYAASLESSLKDEGLLTEIFSFEAGEHNKTIENCTMLMNKISQSKYSRDTAILALGGGVVGDMAGFIAAIYNRGIPYIQIPTTMIAQADSSIGGKTAVDTEFGKNLVGAFKQPKRVYIDVGMIKTLSDRDYKSGLAETIKYGIIKDEEFFKYLYENIDMMQERTPEFLLHVAKNNCRIKKNVIEIDPDEKGLRRILNYGHTIGHAIEKLGIDRYNKNESNVYLTHGEAISIGMMASGRIANALGYFSKENLEKQEKLLSATGLPIKIPPEISDGAIIEITSMDKKSKTGKARYVLPIAIGRMHDFNGVYATYVDDKVVKYALQQTR